MAVSPVLKTEQTTEELLGRFCAMSEWMNEWIYFKNLFENLFFLNLVIKELEETHCILVTYVGEGQISLSKSGRWLPKGNLAMASN